jgi:hypothetical protein
MIRAPSNEKQTAWLRLRARGMPLLSRSRQKYPGNCQQAEQQAGDHQDREEG